MEDKNYGFIPAEYLRPDLSAKLYRTTYSYLKRFYSENLFSEICKELKMPLNYLLDEHNWVSVAFGSRFAECVRLRTGDPEIYRKIGRYYLTPENIGLFEYTVVKSLTPILMLKAIRSFYKKTNLVCNLEVEQKNWNSITMRLTSTVPVYLDLVMNTVGVTEGFRDLYGLKNFEVEHKLNDLNAITEFSVTVKFSAIFYYARKSLGIVSLAGLGYFCGHGLLVLEQKYHFDLIPYVSTAFFLLGFGLIKLVEMLRILKRTNDDFYKTTKEKNEMLYEKAELLGRRYKESNLLKELSEDLIKSRQSSELIDKVLKSCEENFGFKRAAVFLVSEARQKLYLGGAIGIPKTGLVADQLEFMYPNPDAKDGFVAAVLDSGKSALIHDVENYAKQMKEKYRSLIQMLGIKSLVISPIQTENSKFGVFMFFSRADDPTLDKQDLFLIENMAAQFALYFESATRYENENNLRRIFQKYVPAPVLDQFKMLSDSNENRLTPKRVEICSLFVDLQGFTTLCDGLAPERIFDLINLFNGYISEILSSCGAILDNIVGDEIVSFFVQSQPDSTLHATHCLNAISKIIENYDNFQNELVRSGFPKLNLGIGAHIGPASLGSVGSNVRMNYTALGETVNIASRLQSLSRAHLGEGVCALISLELAMRAGHQFESKRIQSTRLRGMTKETIFVILDKKNQFLKLDMSA